MNEVMLIGLGMMIMLLIVLLVGGVFVMVRLSKRVRVIEESVTSVVEHELPEIHRNSAQVVEEVFQELNNVKNNIYRTIDSRLDKLDSKIESNK